MPETDLQDFKQFMQQREEAASAYVRGEIEALSHLTTHIGDATFYAPRGGSVHGATEVFATYEHDVHSFAPGGGSTFEILQMNASDGIAYWVGFQRATAYMRGETKAIPFNLRVTEIFRREGTEWKLVHRHADPLVS